MKCKNCNKDTDRKFCSSTCYHEYRKKEAIKKQEHKLEMLKVEDEDFIICKWCGMKVKRVYGIHIKNHHPDKSVADYKKEFPGEPLTCNKDKKATSKNSGLHMKEDKYRKMASDTIRGENNPNHHSKVTKEERQKRSPFSKKFYESRGSDTKTAEIKVKEFVKEALKDRLTETQIEYWGKRCNNNKDANELYKERQRTFTLEKCVNKYGKDIGFDVWRERNIKWSKIVEEKYNNGEFARFCKHNYSNKELEFISKLIENYKPTEKYYCALDGNRQFFRYFKNIKKTFSYDFVIGKKIIEFNGDYWHCNPTKYDETFFNKTLQCTAKEKWDRDSIKLKEIKDAGYSVLIVWEDEYKKDPEGTIKKCIEFLNETRN